jgi:predicted Rossmann-fold nucleotide-binding protein
MGAMATSAADHGARVHAVTLPTWLVPGDQRWDTLVTAESLTERLALLEHMAEAFLVLAGGAGTAHELMSAWADASNGHHDKPIVVLDPTSLFRGIRQFMLDAAERGYVEPGAPDLVRFFSSLPEAVGALVRVEAAA